MDFVSGLMMKFGSVPNALLLACTARDNFFSVNEKNCISRTNHYRLHLEMMVWGCSKTESATCWDALHQIVT